MAKLNKKGRVNQRINSVEAYKCNCIVRTSCSCTSAAYSCSCSAGMGVSESGMGRNITGNSAAGVEMELYNVDSMLIKS